MEAAQQESAFLVERESKRKNQNVAAKDWEETRSCEAEDSVLEILLSSPLTPSTLTALSDALNRVSSSSSSSSLWKQTLVCRILQTTAKEENPLIHRLLVLLAHHLGCWELYYGVWQCLRQMEADSNCETSVTPPPALVSTCLAALNLLLLSGTKNHPGEEEGSAGDTTTAAAQCCLWAPENETAPDGCFIEPATFVTHITVALPNLVAQVVCTVPTPFRPGPWQEGLVASALAHRSERLGAELLRHLLRRDGSGSEAVAKGLYCCVGRGRGETTAAVVTYVQTVLRDVLDSQVAILLRAMLRYSVAQQRGETTTGSVNWMREVGHKWISRCWEAAGELIVLRSSSVVQRGKEGVDPRLCRAWADVLHNLEPFESTSDEESDDDDEEEYNSQLEFVSAPSDRLLARTVAMVARMWSSSRFVRNTNGLLQQHVTFFLLHGLELLGEKTPNHVQTATSLYNGVSERLKSFVPAIRLDGMRVGELLARQQGQELSFPELAEHENRQQKSVEVEATSVSPDTIVEVTTLDDNVGTKVEHYSFEDDQQEDLLNVPTPLYLSECLDLLRAPETDEHAGVKQETALLHVSDLVRSRPIDLYDHAPELARVLLRSENKTNMEQFDTLTRKALCSLVTQDPRAVGLYLIGEMFEDGTLNDRLFVLGALQDGAMELSGNSALHSCSADRTLPL